MLLLLSFGGSLRKWHEAGILSREIELYLEYLRLDLFSDIDIFSYDPDDAASLALIDCEPAIRARLHVIVPQPSRRGRMGALRHSLDRALVRRMARSGVSVVKTNQASGGWTALLFAAAGIPIFARCGYILSRRHWKNRKIPQAAISWALEFALFNAARVISVTTDAAAATVRSMTFGRRPVFVAPTYVNTDLFKGDVRDKPQSDAVIFVGRLTPQKNVLALVEAVKIAGVPLTIVGDGPLRGEVDALITRLGADVSIIPRLQNTEIAALYRTHRLFALPSVHEGLPKVLIEAMSAEMICVGTAVPGIVDMIEDGRTGYLAPDLAPATIAAAIDRARSDPARERVAAAARAHVLARHSLRSYVEREFDRIRAAIPSLGRGDAKIPAAASRPAN
ncbi:glycosyltransferase family 4 protein [Aureimonas sp. AU12]|uniref:glycosyltransferase family 4 protein n=1 Tax=Aureimonas sp. AU12 TaxID=1638161 RepID=UPI00078249A2|nr:glycosyltransferase family 4 protein [Aureimonas sp. AU12]